MILEKIRSRTSDVHKRLEENSGLSRITQSSFSLQEYIAVLHKFYGFIQPIEKSLSEISNLASIVYDISRRYKSDLLATDIFYLLPSQDFESIPKCHDRPIINNLNQALGYLYVIEGSTLGGKTISDSISNNLNINPDTGGAYFTSYGHHRGIMWKGFVTVLNNCSLNEVEKEEVVEASYQTFLKLESWLNK